MRENDVSEGTTAPPVGGCPIESPACGWFAPGAFATFLGLILFAAFGTVLLGSQSFYYRDFGMFGYPLAFFHRQSFWHGEIPLWNPFNNSGLPFLAQWNTLALYPLSLIYLLLPLPWSLNVFCLGHLFLAGLAMRALAFHWVGNPFAACVAGLAFALNGLMLHCLMWPNNIAALAWAPLLILFSERACREGGRMLLLAVAVATLQMLAGAPEIILFTWLFVGVVAAGLLIRGHVRAGLLARRFACVALLVAGLSAIQLLPFLDLLAHSNRDQTFATTQWAMPAWGWANLVVPLFHCSPSLSGVFSQNDQQWTSSYYLGIGVLAFAFLAALRAPQPRVWLLIGIALFSLLMALGENGPLFGAIKRLVPQVGFARYPIKFVVLATIAIPLLAAFGASRLAAPSGEGRGPWRTALILWIALLLLILGLLWWAIRFPFPDDRWAATWKNGLGRGLLLTLILVVCWLRCRSHSARLRGLFGLAVLLFMSLDAFTHTPRQNPTVPAFAFDPGLSDMKPLPAFGESRAMISRQARAFIGFAATTNALAHYVGVRRALYANCNLLDEVPKVDGFFSLYLREEAQVRALLYGASNGPPTGLADFLAVSQISAPTNFFGWVTRPDWIPVVTAGQNPIFGEGDQALLALASADFNPRHVVYLPSEAAGRLSVTNRADSRILSQRVRPHRIDVEVDAKEPTLVVVAQSYYHAWKAFVNERPARLWRANHAFQSIEVPAGHSMVRLVYVDRSFQAGMGVSLLTALACLAGWYRLRTPINAPG